MASSSTDGARADPPKLRHKPQKREIGAGKRYADQTEFDADVDEWELERVAHRARMKERERELDKLRDRSGRQRDGEGETDGERRVRLRQETAGAAEDHAEREAARRVAKRLAKQRARAHDVAAFAAVFDGFAPRFKGNRLSFAEAQRIGIWPEHVSCRASNPGHDPGRRTAQRPSIESLRWQPLAYRGFRKGWWLKDGAQIRGLHEFIESNPPTGDDAWETQVDKCALRLWRAPSLPSSYEADSDWHPMSHPGDGWCMLLSLPSALPLMRTPWAVQLLLAEEQKLISPGDNEELARRGFEPLAGWEPLVQAGYMPRPAYFELSASEVRHRRARFYFEDAFYLRSTTVSTTRFSPGVPSQQQHPGERGKPAWHALGADEVCRCRWNICPCLGVVLDANLNPVQPYRAARLEHC